MNHKKHIAFVIHDANPVPYFNWFAEKSQSDNEFKFTFIFLNEDITPVKDKMKEYNAEVIWIPFNNQNKKKSLVKAFFSLRKLFKKLRPDIVHSHLFYDGVVALRAAKWAGVKIRVQTKQSTGFNWYYAPKAVRFDRMKNKLATHLIAVSGECEKFIIEKEKADPRKVTLVNHGVDVAEVVKSDPEEIKAFKQKYNPQGKVMMIMVARYIDWKGYKFYIKAAAEVLKKNSNVVFLGVGTGPQEKELRELISELKIENDFILTGFIERKLIPSLYQSADVYVHTAIREPFGFVIAEAMLNQLPLITTPTGAAGDAIKHLENGFLVRYENADDVVEGMNHLLSLSDEERKIMGKRAEATAKELFSFEHMWKGYTDIYKKAIDNLN